MKKTLTIAIAAAALLGSTAALADHHAAGGEPRGDITRADALARAAEQFSKMDVNGDGQLSEADREAKRRERFDASDTDGNGQLSDAEVTAARQAKETQHAGRRAGRNEQRGEAGARHGKGGGKHGAMGRHTMGRMMQQTDTDQSGTISEAEFTAAALARFDSADANNDGTVTAEERQAKRAAMRGQMRGQMHERMKERRAQAE